MILTSTAFRAKLLDTSSRVIRSKITVYDTKMAVRSKGIPFQFYNETSSTPSWGNRILPSNSGDPYCVMPNLSLSWSYGAPFYMDVNYFAVDTGNCWFNAEESSSTFGIYIFGEGVSVDAWIGGAGFNISNTALSHSPSVYASYGSINVTAGNWSRFRFRFYGQAGIRHGGVAAMYTYNYTGDLQADKGSLRVFNAGVVSPTNAWAESAEVTHHGEITGSRVKNEPTSYSFTLPYGTAPNAYYGDNNNFYTNGTAFLQEGRLIEISAGYDLDATPNPNQTEGTVSGNTEYIPRFTGFISGFEIDRAASTLTVRCVDFFGLADSSFCINYPDSASYWTAGYYLDNEVGEPYGLVAPIAYDRWGVVAAIRDLFIKAGLPASLFYDMEKGRTGGDDLSDTIPSVYDAGFALESANYYGTSQAEEYVNTFDLGTTVHTAVMKIADTYGYFIDFKPNGSLRFHPQDNPTADTTNNNESRLDEEDQVYSQTAININERIANTQALGGGFRFLQAQDETITFTNPGGGGSGIPATGFSIVFVRDANSGANDNQNLYWQGTASVKVEIRQYGGEIIRTYNYNLRFQDTVYYNDGVSPLVGANPCVIHLDRNLLFDEYEVIVTALGAYDIKVDELWVYHTNASTPVKLLQTYRIVNQVATLKSIDFSRDISDTRNDILAVGNRKGIWVAGGGEEAGLEDPNFTDNNNNQYTNYNFRSMDVESIYNPNAANYVGRHLMTYIQEPNINSDNRAKWLSYSILSNYKDFDKRVNMNVIGDPEITIGDPITMLDRLEENATNLVWVQGVQERINKTDWDIGLDVIGKQPFPSYDEAPDFNIEDDWNGRYLSDFTIGDQFGYSRDGNQKGTLLGNHAWTATTVELYENPVALGWATAGSMVVYNPRSLPAVRDGNVTYGVFTYTGRTSSSLTGVVWRYVTSASNLDAPVAVSGWKVENIYNPYEQADYNNFFTVSFRCLVEGNIYIGVKSMNASVFNFISGLSSGGGLDEDNLPKEERVSAGDVIEKIWGGVDQTGASHKVVGVLGLESDIKGGFFAEPDRYQIVVEYTRSEDNKSITMYSGNYTDELSNQQNQSIEINMSDVDVHQPTYTFENNNYAVPYPNLATSPQYSLGGTARTDVSIWADRININAVWVAGTDGDININLYGYHTNTPRKYFVTYWVNGHMLETRQGSVDGDIVRNTKVIGVEEKQLNEGKAVTWGGEIGNGYIFPFNPNRFKFGAINFDEDFLNYSSQFEWMSPWEAKLRAKGYYIRLIMDIRDASGRRSINRGSVRRPQSNQELWQAINTIYSDFNWNTIMEWYQVPTIVHTDSNYSDVNAYRSHTTFGYWLPFFEAPTKPPLCSILSTWTP